jgi:hypothetical protein
MNGSGYVARKKGGVGLDSEDLQFLMDKKHKTKEKIFENRAKCLEWFWEVQHYGEDDLRYLIWFEEGEDIPRNLFTNEILAPCMVHGEENMEEAESYGKEE